MANNQDGLIDYTPPPEPGMEGLVDYKPPVSALGDIGRGTAAGLATGTAGLVGFPGDIQEALKGSGLNDWLIRKAHEILPEAFFKAAKPGGYALARSEGPPAVTLPTTQRIKEATGLSALDYEPETMLGKLAKGGAEFVPGAVVGTSARSVPGLLADVARFGVAPGVAQEGVGQALKGTSYEGTPIETAARFVTSLGTGAAAGKFISPNVSKLPPASQQAYAGQVRQLEERGLPISPGERSDVRVLRYGESEGNPELMNERLEAVTRHATSAVGNGQGGNHGVNIMRREPQNNTLDNMLRETGSRVGNTWASNRFVPDANLGVDLMNLRHNYTTTNLFGEETVNRLHDAANEMRDALQHARVTGQVTATGQPYLTGQQAHRLYSRTRAAARGTANPNTETALNEFANALGENMERSVAGTPAAGRLAEANRDYRNALVIEKASKASNNAGAAGYITPAKLEEAANQVFGVRNHQRGYDAFNWAPAAKSVYKIMPDSGTSPRQQYHAMFDQWGKGIGAVLGSLIGKSASGIAGGGVEHSVLGAIIGEALSGIPAYALKKGAGLYADTRLGAAHLGNQLLAGQPGALRERLYNPVTGETNRSFSLPSLLTAVETLQQEKERRKPLQIIVSKRPDEVSP